MHEPSPQAQAGNGAPIGCWVVTDGKAGMENQCLGLAEAIGTDPVVKRIRVRAPWRWLPPGLWLDPLAAVRDSGGDAMGPPWPDLLIATGRLSVAPALAVRRASRAKGRPTFVVQIQNPTVDPSRFDLVVAPAHDRLAAGPNVMATAGALHRVTPARLAAEAARLGARFADLPRPRVAVLVGGPNGRYRLHPALARDIGARLAAFARRNGASLLVTPSRRTGAENEAALRAALAGVAAHVWDGSGENPYFAFLGLADAIVVTNDSVSMASEAASTGKPLYVIRLEGSSAKFDRFHASLEAGGIARPFDGRLDSWSYRPLDDTARVAAVVRERLGLAAGCAAPIAIASADAAS